MRHNRDIGLYDFSMALIIVCLHNFGTIFSVKHLLSISSSHLCKAGFRLCICFASTSSMPAGFAFLSAAITFLYSNLQRNGTLVLLPSSICTLIHWNSES